ncbi:MAG: hypothetical protein CL758_07425 [Chloroflexi bacterium]|nr:hypothetical protein [Chloroflexota bacterium]|tara:strand:- start:42662 stop:43237 length:576 start_codon:yes stop_codon:yes gene_type:complete
MNRTIFRLINYIEVNLPQNLKNHINRACKIGEDLSEINNVDLNKVKIALLGHDLYRAYNNKELLKEAEKNNLYISKIEKLSPILLHGKLASLKLKKGFQISDKEILHSVKWHTSAHKDMSKIFKVVFLSDKIEPEKLKKSTELAQIRKIAYSDLDLGLLMYLNYNIKFRINRNEPIHPYTIQARNLLQKTN